MEGISNRRQVLRDKGYATVGKGEGGHNEDHEYFGELANI
jgi:hypothetical protein